MHAFVLPLIVVAVALHSQLAEATSHRSVIENAVRQAKVKVDRDYEYSRRESLERVRRNIASPADILRLMKQPSGATRSAVRASDYMEYAVHLLQDHFHKHRIHKRSINATDLISEEDLTTIADLTGCSARLRPPSCETTPNLERFRTANSECNNRKYPRLGAANTPFTRWLPAEYQDGRFLPQGWDREVEINGHVLPLVRLVSNRIVSVANSDVESDPLYTHLVTIFGQWTDHDLTFTPHSPVIRSFNDGIDCDKTCERTEPCFPIELPEDDPRLKKQETQEQECIPFFRSAAACGSGTTGYIFGAGTIRQQINTLTAFIDAGQVYGSDSAKARYLRDLTNDKGLLRVNKMYNDSGRAILPFSPKTDNTCANRGRITNDSTAQEVPCFVAGDERSNENIALTSLHTLLLREHNRLARALALLNPNWSGERLYQETRKILGAYFQVITFRDYLRHIVGPDFIAKQLSNYPGYNEMVNPSIANVFATAAYRFAHLQVQPFIFRLDEDFEEPEQFGSVLLHKAFFTPWRVVFEGGLDPILRGLVGRRAKLNRQDSMMHDELRERLFQFSSELALDLAALNMQRGRDHGIPGYNAWRKFCGLSEPKNQVELAAVLKNSELAENLLALYGTADNIDVWLGGIAEPFVNGGRVGPLFACIISTQFERIRAGDRLWYENDNVFTDEQRESLVNSSLARIICDNTGLSEVPEHPFEYRPRGSGYTRCEDIPTFDLTPWRENRQVSEPSEKPSENMRGPRGLRGPPGPQGPPGPPGSTPTVAFSLRLGNDFPKVAEPLRFKEVIYNEQNVYDTQTGMVTCEEPGVYEFQFHFTIHGTNGNVDLRHNTELVLHSFTTKQNGYVSASGSTLIRLNKGDTVYLIANFNGNGLTADSYFSGHLVFTA